MINVPLIKSVESALSVYYTYPQLKNAEIKEVFGHLSNAKVCQLKELAREKMNELGIPLWNATAGRVRPCTRTSGGEPPRADVRDAPC